MQGFRPILERLECRINPVPVDGIISGRIWNDLDSDGIQDSAEPAVAGAIVDLVLDLDEVPGNADDVVVESVIANSSGEYRFIAYIGDPRPHYIVFRPPVNDPPVTSSFSPADVGSNDAIDSDADPSTGRTPHFDLYGSLDFDCGMVGPFPGVNDPPTFRIRSDIVYVYKNSGPYSENWAWDLNPGTPDEVGQNLTFEIVSNLAPELFSAGPAIDSNGTLTFTPAVDTAGAAHLYVRLKDDGGTANGGQDTSAAQHLVIYIYPVTSANHAPSFLKGPDIVVYEDSGPFAQTEWATDISAGPPDEANQQLQFLIHGNTNPSLFSVAPAISPDGTLTFTPAPDAYGSATITFRLWDNGGNAYGGTYWSPYQSFSITVEPPEVVNDAPSFESGSNVVVNEDSGAFVQSEWATNINAGPFEGGQLVHFEVTGNTDADLFAVGPSLSSSGTLTFTPADNTFGTATITIQLRDNGGTSEGGSDTSPPQTFTITINPVNDRPSFIKGPDFVIRDNSGPMTQIGWATNIKIGSANEAGQSVQFETSANTNPSLFTVAPAISPDGTLTFTPATNVFGIAAITLQLKDDGGTEDGGIDTSIVQTFTITIEPTLTVVGADAGGEPVVGLYSAGGVVHEEFLAYKNGFHGGVRVTVGDVNGDGVADIVTAPGAGMASIIEVWSGDGRALLSSFQAFPSTYRKGAHVAVGNFDADDKLEIAVSRGHGKGRVKMFDINGPTATQVGSFVAFGQRGARLAAGDFDGVDGDEIIAISAQGGARVKVYGVEHGKATLQQSFVTHAKAKTGGFVAAADFNGDQLVEIIAGGVESGVGTVKLFSGGTGEFLDSFTPYDPQASKSLRVATVDLNGDGQSDAIVTAPGAGVPGPLVRRFDALSLDHIDEFFAHGAGGAFVAG